ncbi:hypothetical protein JMJ35_008040 [Cladonia borealis]|uniref:Uncharacterized protein n=1 Tax=Cladonia borealis TaxID=184061 RepID=A0AA39QXI2_9LECA|nr:hypothetical protein JMJ35_008040 [Cladonia borealis]
MGRHIRALIIPSDGSPLHMIHIKTVNLEPHAPSPSLGHHPDFHKYWGLAGWEHRIATPMQISNQTLSCLNGKYYLFQCLLGPDAGLEANKHIGGGRCYGDAFIVRVLDDGGDGRGDAAYEDVPRELLGTRLVLRMVSGEEERKTEVGKGTRTEVGEERKTKTGVGEERKTEVGEDERKTEASGKEKARKGGSKVNPGAFGRRS